jgi:phage-related protein
MRRSVALTLLSSALFALAGCKSPCRQLSERLCDCVEPFERDTCIRNVANEENGIETTDEQLEVCEQRLETCNFIETDTTEQRKATCARLQTDEGKQACGLAR